MGQHTWFLKNKELFLKQKELFKKIEDFEENKIYLDDMELYQINYEINQIEEENNSEYHDLFRTSLRNDDGTYTDQIISSRKECLNFINDASNRVSFKRTFLETKEQEEENRKKALERINDFWDKYDNGIIRFG